MRLRILALPTILLLMLYMAPRPVEATDAVDISVAASSIKDSYHHVAWTAKDGAPVGIWAITQTLDGWLWLGCASGLYRFDGVSFERIDLLPADSLESRSVRAMLATDDGSLWVLFAIGRVARLPPHDRSHPTWITGIPSIESPQSLDEDGSGRIFAFTASSKVYAAKESEFQLLGRESAFPTGKLKGTVVDARGNYWVSSAAQLSLERRESRVFETVQNDWPKGATLGVSHHGQLWTSDGAVYRLVDMPGSQPPASVPLRSKYDTPDLLNEDGAWWSVSCPEGVCRARPETSKLSQTGRLFAADSFTHQDGLSSDRAMTLYEDQEGNIWVGTKQGLDQFRRNEFITVKFPAPVNYFSMAVDPERGIWVGTDSANENAQDTLWKVDSSPKKLPAFAAALTSVFEEPDGSALFGGTGGAWRLVNGQMMSLRSSYALPAEQYRTIAEDGTGRLWASFRGDHTYRLADTGWILKGGLPELHDGMALSAARDADGNLWLGFKDDAISLIRGNTVENFSAANGLKTGPVTSLSLTEPILVGGEFGAAVFDKKRFFSLNTDHPESLKGITGIVRTRQGDIFLYGNAGAVRLRADDLKRALENPAFPIHSRIYDAEDGLNAGAQQAVGAPSVVEDRQGRLWFATADGLAMRPPKNEVENPRSPPTEVLDLTAEQVTYRATPNLQLPAGTHDLSIRYTALGLRIPQRIQFRFRLSGVDKQWRSMGNVRSANYSNLVPGAYRIDVLASNEAGVWSDAPTVFEFAIGAFFYQTLWFKAACAALALLSCIVSLRILSVRTQSRALARMGERMQERERIARELHDTLLQDVQALGLNLRGLRLKYGQNNEVGTALAELDEAAKRSLTQARARVSGLRADGDGPELSEVIREFGDQLAALYPANFHVDCVGTIVRLHPVAGDEIISIVREALLNAFRHAQAQHIKVLIRYSSRQLEITISDDGKGMSQREDDESRGHWGIIGMQERARTLKSNLAIQSPSGGGTTVMLQVSAAIAFASNRT